jgi:hypothetical protein
MTFFCSQKWGKFQNFKIKPLVPFFCKKQELVCLPLSGSVTSPQGAIPVLFHNFCKAFLYIPVRFKIFQK